MQEANPDVMLISKGNAGIPEWRGTELHYNASPEVMAAYADRARKIGVTLIGGCCGSSAEHIELMRAVLDGRAPVPEVEEITATTQLVAKDRPARRRRNRRADD
jgi:5-methyltetrahydrofolate--homocysteine methyltransferase